MTPFALRHSLAGALALAAVTIAAGAARADIPSWVTCEPAVDNAPLVPLADGTFPPDPAYPIAGAQTQWSTNGLEINLQINTGPKKQFVIKGVNYEPTQIGGSAEFSPFNDFFYTNTNDTWSPLWDRDVGPLRAMGVNAVRNYGMWKWEPGFQGTPSTGSPIGTAGYWDAMNWDANKAAEKDTQFCQGGAFAYKHPTHIPFLDEMWNGGGDPIYVWVGISIDERMFGENLSPQAFNDYLQFYLHTAKWLAKKYGDHPAVMGFVVGNEIGNARRAQTSQFWDTINQIHQVVKASAPNKLTASVFHDTPDYTQKITSGKYAGKTGPQVYQPDVWAFNPYNNVGEPGNALDRYAEAVVTGCKTIDGNSCVKPLIWGEWGAPANTRETSKAPSELYPVRWTAPNFIWMKAPPAAQCLSAGEQGPPPGSGADAEADYKRGQTSAVLLPSRPGDYVLPQALGKFYKNSARQPGDALPAALQADYFKSFWKVSSAHRADNSAAPSDWKFTSGGFAFEYRDEWWKVNEHPDFHGISGTPTNCPGGCGSAGCQPGAANPVFPGGWGDEQWFGIHGAKANGRGTSQPVVDPNTGKLNGGPDILNPRAAVVAICEAYGGCASVN